jgi:hypothetical protein
MGVATELIAPAKEEGIAPTSMNSRLLIDHLAQGEDMPGKIGYHDASPRGLGQCRIATNVCDPGPYWVRFGHRECIPNAIPARQLIRRFRTSFAA